jgi:pimeloyl-ACP methyl ester carboxylesterase
MTTVFVHGVAETFHIWDRLIGELDSPSVALELPGFGVGVPAGFDSDKDSYVDWLVDQLTAIEGPIDLVGHDWGALFTLRIATARPEVRLRTWVADIASVFRADYEWHPRAAGYIEPILGEQRIRAWRETTADDPDGVVAFYRRNGLPQADAVSLAAAHDARMSRSVLALYRSANPNIGAEWDVPAHAPTRSPGLVLHPQKDVVDDPTRSREVADRLGATWVELDGMTHWWMYDQTGRVPEVLTSFWRAADQRKGEAE